MVSPLFRVMSRIAVFLAFVAAASCGSYDPQLTIQQLVPSRSLIESTDAREFSFNGRAVHLTWVQYGPAMDCPAGCIWNELCAIEDGQQALLFGAHWMGPDREPVTIAAECPILTLVDDTNSCLTSGLRHPVTATDSFRQWAMSTGGRGIAGCSVYWRAVNP